ncbi:MAG: 2-isopropylmalate synthase [Acetivibrionales bacterium]|jgi:2-isopropylmalate synthase|nr:2-isopropylmalate synthase [Clostridiaceae bacterium]
MSRQVYIFDTTLRDGEQSPGCSMNLQEKIEVAKQLERMKVDVIEAGFAISSPGDFQSVKSIADTIKDCTVASLSRTLPQDIDRSWEAIKNAVSPRIHVFLATSPIHMKYKLRMSPEEVLERSKKMVAYAKKYCSDIEFSAEDATRSEPEFLYRVFEAVIDAGATVINVPDTVGYTTPEEFYELIKNIRENVGNSDKAKIAVHCHNDLGMAVANTLAAARAGATQLECTINGIGERAGNAALEEIVMAIKTRPYLYDMNLRLDTTQITRSSKLISSITGVPVQPNKAIVGANAFAHESGIHQHGVLKEKSTYEIITPESVGLSQNNMVLGKHSGRHAFEDRLKILGYNLTKDELDETFNKFKVLADKKKVVQDADLEVLLQHKAVEVPEIYKLDRFVINTGNTITATASVRLIKQNGENLVIEEVSTGDGPIDAAFKAVEKIAGVTFTLEDYTLRSVTEGQDAQGEAYVKIRSGARIYTGKGVSTDVFEASVLSYVNAINKMIHEEKLEEVLPQ